jgi:hypothetical protein
LEKRFVKFINGFNEVDTLYTINDIKSLDDIVSNYHFCECENRTFLQDSLFLLRSKNSHFSDRIILLNGNLVEIYDANSSLHIINELTNKNISRCQLSMLKIWIVDNLMQQPLKPLKERQWINKNSISNSKELFPKYSYYTE